MEIPVTVREAEDYLNSIPRFSREKHDMASLYDMLRYLDAVPDDRRVIHVAGTNGKGSVCAYLESVWRHARYSTALFTSPHLVDLNERFCFDGKPVSDERLLSAFRRVYEAGDELKKRGGNIPTYFEYLFLMFCIMEAECPHDVIVLETGLGGRLDATNCLPGAMAAVITSISLDHMQYLGDTTGKIAAEKAGIIRKDVPLFYDDTCPEASEVIAGSAREAGCPAFPVGERDILDLRLTDGGLAFRAVLRDGEEARELSVPFQAPYQAVNALLAARTARNLGIAAEDICQGIKDTRWPGRMEEILPGFWLDGGHNDGGIRAFVTAAGAICSRHPDFRRYVMFAVSSDKEYEKMLAEIGGTLRPDLLLLTTMESYRSLDEGSLKAAAARLRERGIRTEVSGGVRDALERMMSLRAEDSLLFAAGSLYMVGEVKKVMKEIGRA